MRNKTFRWFLVLLTVVALGTVLLAACARPGTPQANNGGGGGGGGNGGGPPTVHMGDTTFLQPMVTVPKGMKLTLIDDSASIHILLNGAWVGSVPMPMKEAGAPTVANVQVTGNSTITIGPFATAGTFHIYCSIHTGMNLAIIVS